jgi:hypothetical protein
MRVLLRSLKTNHFYAGPDKWAPCSEEAFAFQDLEQAGRIYQQEMMSQMELVLSYVQPNCELRLPIPKDLSIAIRSQIPKEFPHRPRA